MGDITGRWQLRMKTPIGTINAVYTFARTATGLTGTAVGAGEETPLLELSQETTPTGERVTWTQRITRPLRLNLEYDVLVTDDTLSGHSRAGRLPRTEVTGHRLTD